MLLFALCAADALAQNGVFVRVLLAEYLAPYARLAAEVAPLLRGNAVLFYEEEIRSGGFGENLLAALLRADLLGARNTHVLGAEQPFASPTAEQSMWQAAGVSFEDAVLAVNDLIMKSKKENLP